MRLFELIATSVYPYKETANNDGTFTFDFEANGLKFMVDFYPYIAAPQDGEDSYDDVWVIEFHRDASHLNWEYSPKDRDKYHAKKPGSIEATAKIFGTIEFIATIFLDVHKPDRLIWFGDTKMKRLVYSRFKHPNYVFYKNHQIFGGGLGTDPEEGLVRR